MKKAIAFILSLAFPYRGPSLKGYRQIPDLPISGPAGPGFFFRYRGPAGNQLADYLNSRREV